MNLQITREDEGALIVLCVQGDISSVNAEVLEAAVLEAAMTPSGYRRYSKASIFHRRSRKPTTRLCCSRVHLSQFFMHLQKTETYNEQSFITG